MYNRKEKIKELMNSFHALKSGMASHSMFFKDMPRVTPAQMAVLMLLKKDTQSTIKHIANAMCITSSATTQLVDELVKNGHIIRSIDSKDRRAVALKLSVKTKKLTKKIEDYMINSALEFFNVLNEKEFNEYMKLNKKIVEKSLKKQTK